MFEPLVSIIIMSYNYGRFIGQTIQSMLDQTYQNWELVIVDDCSKDNSVEVIQSFTDPRISLYVQEVNKGASRAYNRAYEYCQGKYFGSVDADDYFAPDKLAKQVAYMEAHPDIDFTGTYIIQINEAGEEVPGRVERWVNREFDLDTINNWAIFNHLCHSTVLIRKSSHDRLGGLNPDLHLCPDFDLWLRGRVNEMRFRVLPDRVTYYRTHQSNVSHNVNFKRFMSEFAYLYRTTLGPYLTRIYRPDLIEQTIFYIAQEFFPGAPTPLKLHFMQVLSAFPLYPTEAEPFIEAIERQLDPEIWQYLRKNPKTVDRSLKVDAPAPKPEYEKDTKLIIVDDYFPNVITSFRVQEFNYYLQRLNCEIYSFNPDFDEQWEKYAGLYPQFKDRVKRFIPEQDLNGSLVYTVFLANTFRMLRLIESEKVPFCFTLYAGGEFRLNDPESDYKLLKVFNSPFFRKVIVTRQATYDYLVYNDFCPAEKIEFIPGAVFPTEYYIKNMAPRRVFGEAKSNLDICFVALKYTEKGVDKGYDTFIKVAKKLSMFNLNIRFHVVGDFDRDDIDVESLGNQITFYGLQPTSFFPGFYAGMDLILSPNLPFKLAPGAFDGFPTGACTEAGINGVAVFCTDVLNDNLDYKDGEEIVIITPDPDEITRKIMDYFCEPEKLALLARRGQARFQEINSTERMLRSRFRVLTEYI